MSFVYDTSAYINGWNDHYLYEALPSVWGAIGDAIDDGRIVLPREVYRELQRQDDELKAWIAPHHRRVMDPPGAIQEDAVKVAAEIRARGGGRRGRDAADPWVIATARILGLTVVSYEGRDFTGPTKNWDTKMPGICQALGVKHCTLPRSLVALGVKL